MSLLALVRSVGTFDSEERRESVEKTEVLRRIAARLDIDARRLSVLLESTPYHAAALLNGQGYVEVGTKEFRNAVRMVRLCAALRAIFGHDHEAMKAWLVEEDPDLGATPWAVMTFSEEGFEEVLDHVGIMATRAGPAIP